MSAASKVPLVKRFYPVASSKSSKFKLNGPEKQSISHLSTLQEFKAKAAITNKIKLLIFINH
jgi:hypothetical protein